MRRLSIFVFILTQEVYRLTWSELLLSFFLLLHSLLSFFFLLISSNASSEDLTSPSITTREESIISATLAKMFCEISGFFNSCKIIYILDKIMSFLFVNNLQLLLESFRILVCGNEIQSIKVYQSFKLMPLSRFFLESPIGWS